MKIYQFLICAFALSCLVNFNRLSSILQSSGFRCKKLLKLIYSMIRDRVYFCFNLRLVSNVLFFSDKFTVNFYFVKVVARAFK